MRRCCVIRTASDDSCVEGLGTRLAMSHIAVQSTCVVYG